ncbi:MAG: NAD(+)/NADH kinase [Candidatus Omnitrophica bacterium]|nr:NAD(+)/NADH kinase [Candidatus Omnitrophota bacterium]
MKLRNVLLFYKKSAYKIYFLEQRSYLAEKDEVFAQKELDSFRKAHKEHYATLKKIEAVLSKYHIHFTKSYRGQIVDFDAYDLVVTIGGDGTFLEAARGINRSILLGVNSSLSYSVGKFCVVNIHNFEAIIKKILKKDFKASLLHRLRLGIDGYCDKIDCLNDVLISHNSPASMNRYILKIGKIKEEQRSSGVWIATPAGSSGGIHSAGGRKIPYAAKKLQYRPRELYKGGRWRYKLTGGILSARQSIRIISMMRQGRIYVDGTHLEIPFPLGASIEVTLSPIPLKTITA